MYTQKKPIENAHIVRERDRRRFRELLAVFALGVPIGLFLLLFTWQNLEVIRLGREVTRLQKIQKQIDEENKKHQFELDRLTALESVEKRAHALGLTPTDSRSVVLVNPHPSLRDTLSRKRERESSGPTPAAAGEGGPERAKRVEGPGEGQ